MFHVFVSVSRVAVCSNAREEEELFVRLAPRCPQHQRAGKLLTVRKTGLNRGRKFYACSLPRGNVSSRSIAHSTYVYNLTTFLFALKAAKKLSTPLTDDVYDLFPLQFTIEICQAGQIDP